MKAKFTYFIVPLFYYSVFLFQFIYTYVINLHFLVVVVSFNESAYNANENDEQVQPVLVLSQPSSTDISVLITVLDGNATGQLISILLEIFFINFAIIYRRLGL